MPGAMQKMLNKKSRLGKKGNLANIMGFAMVFCFISIVYIFIALFLYVSANDYLFYNLQNLTEQLEADNIVKAGTAAQTQVYGDDFTSFNFHMDDLWLTAYIIFIATSLIVSYKSKQQSYFSFLAWLFYGLMIFLFLLTIFATLTNWFKDEVLLRVIPTAAIVVPKFYYYLSHIGIFSAFHLVACLVANMLDFDFSKIIGRKKQEEAAMEDNEVV